MSSNQDAQNQLLIFFLLKLFSRVIGSLSLSYHIATQEEKGKKRRGKIEIVAYSLYFPSVA